MDDFLQDLNDRQKEAVKHKDGALLLIAGAGAGKTKTIAHRIATLIEGGVPGEKILAVTFTNKASEEMRKRVQSLLRKTLVPQRYSEDAPLVTTFHRLGAQIIRENTQLAKRTRHFSIYDRNDSLSILKKSIEGLGISTKELDPKKVLARISQQKGNAITHTAFEDSAIYGINKNIARVWGEYEKKLQAANALDFDDLILAPLVLFRSTKSVRDRYQQKFRYIHIDEYQDTNAAQYELVRILASAHGNVCAVGDADQAIYGWRGADYTNILNFEEDFPNAQVVRLEQNYRSTKTIIAASNSVIQKNKSRKEKHLYTQNKTGEKLVLFSANNEQGEAEYVALKIEELIASGIAPYNIAVLYRANFQSRVLEESFISHILPYQVLGTRFYDRKEIKDLLAYIKVAFHENDQASLERIINVPARGIGKVTLAKILSGKKDTLSGSIKKRVDDFFALLLEIKDKIYTLPAHELIMYIISHTGLEAKLKHSDENDIERLTNMYELVTIAKRYDSLSPPAGIETLLNDAALMASDQDYLKSKAGGIKLMTVHASKGLEFQYVFIVGLEEDLFPHVRDGARAEDAEEERRLFYVALTRAQECVFLSYAMERTLYGQTRPNLPSSYIFDIDKEHIDATGDDPLTTISIE